MTETLKHTPMYTYNQQKDVKMIDFGGWALPVSYTKIQDEHNAVRNKAGIFDVSHMGEVFITGETAEQWINSLITNDLTNIEVGQCQYTAMTYEDGGMVDDLIFFKLSKTRYLVTPNASNKDKVVDWLKTHNKANEVMIDDQSDQIGLIALQGPNAEKILSEVTDLNLSDINYYHFQLDIEVAGVKTLLVSRTGYTGEDGFEIYLDWNQLESTWLNILEAGRSYGLQECGLGSRDTLRLEAGFPLYGNEFNETIDPITGGIGFVVKLNKPQSFVGQKALKQIKDNQTGVKRSYGFEITDKGIVRQGAKLFVGDEEVGVVTSGTKSPTLNKSIGMAIVNSDKALLGTEVEFEVRRRRLAGILTKKNWLKR